MARALGVLAAAALASSAALTPPAVARPGRPSAATSCQARPGRTVFHRGAIRVFTPRHAPYARGEAYGCLSGSPREVALWQTGPEERGWVRQVRGHVIAVQWELGNQYGFSQSISVHNLATGSGYEIATAAGPINGPQTGTPTPFSWPLERFLLAPGGRTVRLYEAYPADTGAGTPAPDAEVLDIVGFHHFKRVLATAPPGAVAPRSLVLHGDVLTWIENGQARSATVASRPPGPHTAGRH